MGDVAMTAPVLTAISRRYGNDVRMVMLTPKFYTPFFFGIDNLEIYNIDLYNAHKGVKGIKRLYNELKEIYSFDLIIDLNYKLFSRLLRKFFILDKIPTFKIDKGRDEKKALTREKDKIRVELKSSIERYADVFREAGFEIEVPNKLPQNVKRTLPKFAQEAIEQRGAKSFIGIAPFAKHQGKTLSLQTIRETIEQISERHPETAIFIFGGGATEKMVADSLVAWYGNTISAIGKCNLEQEMDLMSNLDVMLSMDSSAMHLCSLLGVNVVSVWGATHTDAGFLGLGQSLDNVVSIDLECRPCSVYGHKPCLRGDYKCLTDITAKQIADKLGRYL